MQIGLLEEHLSETRRDYISCFDGSIIPLLPAEDIHY